MLKSLLCLSIVNSTFLATDTIEIKDSLSHNASLENIHYTKTQYISSSLSNRGSFGVEKKISHKISYNYNKENELRNSPQKSSKVNIKASPTKSIERVKAVATTVLPALNTNKLTNPLNKILSPEIKKTKTTEILS